MVSTKLGLYELLAPQFLLGFADYIDKYLSILSVDVLRASNDESGIVYRGSASFGGEGEALPEPKHEDPSGAVFEWRKDLGIEFRLTIPRDGSRAISDILNSGGPSPLDQITQELTELFSTFGNFDQTDTNPTEYPGFRFRLELLIPNLTFHLGKSWVPGMLDNNGRVVHDPAYSGKDVRILLPKAVLEYEQGDDPTKQIKFRFKSWGNSGFDAPSDIEEGEIVTMDPPIALHEKGRWAFSVDQLIVDMSQNHTPPELMRHFGVDETFQGLYLKRGLFLYQDRDKDWSFSFILNDVLISFNGEISLETELNVFGPVFNRNPPMDFMLIFYDGARQIQYTGNEITVPSNVVIRLVIQGGVPKHRVEMKFNDNNIWDGDEREGRIANFISGSNPQLLEVTVQDDTPNSPLTVTKTINLTVYEPSSDLNDLDGLPGDQDPPSKDLAPVELSRYITEPSPVPGGYPDPLIIHNPKSGTVETLKIRGGRTPSVFVDGVQRQLSDNRELDVNIPEDSEVNVVITYPPTDQLEPFKLQFEYERPYARGQPDNKRPQWDGEDGTLERAYINDNNDYIEDPLFQFSVDPYGNSSNEGGSHTLQNWLRQLPDQMQVDLHAHASYDRNDSNVRFNQELSQRRLSVALGIIEQSPNIRLGNAVATGFSYAYEGRNIETDNIDLDGQGRPVRRIGDTNDRVVVVRPVVTSPLPQLRVEATLRRPTIEPQPPRRQRAPVPELLPNKPPSVFRQLNFRVRIERNILVLLEISGELDFETELEKLKRSPPIDRAERLELRKRAGATNSQDDGVVDFKVNITYDTSTKVLTETLSVGAAPGDRDGLLEMRNENERSMFKNMFGALLTFAPIINERTSALDPESAGDWAELAIDLGVPLALASPPLNIFKTKKVTFYGIEFRYREHMPAGFDSATFTDFGIIFDYGVEFGIEINLLGIKPEKPIKIRYKAIGFNIHKDNGLQYQPIFDTSRGYEINIADPSIFNLKGKLGDILKILSVRIARFNPLTLELDLGLKTDLGIVTVDTFKVKQPLIPSGAPMILPSGVKVKIPGAIMGDGHLRIIDTSTSDGTEEKGMEGGIDITLLPLKLRLNASLGISPVEDAEARRKATAVLAALSIEFGSPLPVLGTGFGLYGLSGLFAMHYKRTEEAGDPLGAALGWLQKAEGEPERISRADGVQLWIPELDRWSFGLGSILGTMEGGLLINFRGTVMLELPGPRILVFTKVKILQSLPNKKDPVDVGGILGIVDIDFNLDQITIGILANFKVIDLITIQIPTEIFFSTREWYLDIGNPSPPKRPVTANVLGILRGLGYFMIHGNDIVIPERQHPHISPVRLPGIAVAMGIEVSLFIGSEDIGLYLRVSAGASLGLAFSPEKFFISGSIFLEGELHLFIIGIGVTGLFEVQAPDPTYVHGQVCGEIDLFFFSIGACIDFTLGSTPSVSIEPPPLVLNVYLQSYSPVLTSGQGSDRPIDARLGDAIMLSDGSIPGDKAVPVVPIDSVPVMQLFAAPRITDGNRTTTTFTAPLPTPPAYSQNNGWVTAGSENSQVSYFLKDIYLLKGDPESGESLVIAFPNDPNREQIPATWRVNTIPSGGADTGVDLALFSRIPTAASRAFERSTELYQSATTRWSGTCKPVAPQACILWTFCGQDLGPSGHGWSLTGLPWPDPPGSIRQFPPKIDLFVEEPGMNDSTFGLINRLANEASLPYLVPPKVIGRPSPDNIHQVVGCEKALQLPYCTERHGIISPNDLQITDEVIIRKINELTNAQWITLHIGRANNVQLLMAVLRKLYVQEFVIIRELDSQQTIIKETPVNGLDHIQLVGTSGGLPARWIDLNGPWHNDVESIATFLANPEFNSLDRFMVTIKPSESCEALQIFIKPEALDIVEIDAMVLLAAVEVCPKSEEERVTQLESVQESDRRTLIGYLNGGEKVPLLEPRTTYTLGVTYEFQTRTNDNNRPSDPVTKTQQFRFKTDERKPARLDPWVLGMTPAHTDANYPFLDERQNPWSIVTSSIAVTEGTYHFYEDPVKIAFNDLSAIQLFAAYGKQLKLKVNAADGIPVIPTESAVISRGIPAMQQVRGIYDSSYRDIIEKLIEDGVLPCIGEFSTAFHQLYTAPIELRPLMAYILDIIVDPEDATEENVSSVPLFRRSFSTSKYANLKALAADIRQRPIQHKALNEQITQFMQMSPGSSVVFVSDMEIQSALTNAGEHAIPIPSNTGITIYWARRRTSTQFFPHMILIDAEEPLWRTRLEPRYQTVQNSDGSVSDQLFQTISPALIPAMEIIEVISGSSAAHISKFICSPSGTRTLAFISDEFIPTIGNRITVAIRKLRSQLYEIEDETPELLAEIEFDSFSPWEGEL